VKFSLADGSEVELITADDQFETLTEGQSGTLSWEGETFLTFTRKE
jgi:hypothetical protein